MEIEVNDYVRTKNGLIAKVVYKIEKNSFISKLGRKCTSPERYYLENIKKYSISKPYIAKHSKNIIDLIEWGDYVNGHKVVNEIWGEDDNELYFEIEGGFNKAKYIGEKDIKSVLTKEQFSSLEYII